MPKPIQNQKDGRKIILLQKLGRTFKNPTKSRFKIHTGRRCNQIWTIGRNPFLFSKFQVWHSTIAEHNGSTEIRWRLYRTSWNHPYNLLTNYLLGCLILVLFDSFKCAIQINVGSILSSTIFLILVYRYDLFAGHLCLTLSLDIL